MESISDNVKFWKTIKPFLSEKATAQTNLSLMGKETSIKHVREIFRKTNISNHLIRTRTCARVRIRGLEKLVFQKILRKYLMDDPKV